VFEVDRAARFSKGSVLPVAFPSSDGRVSAAGCGSNRAGLFHEAVTVGPRAARRNPGRLAMAAVESTLRDRMPVCRASARLIPMDLQAYRSSSSPSCRCGALFGISACLWGGGRDCAYAVGRERLREMRALPAFMLSSAGPWWRNYTDRLRLRRGPACRARSPIGSALRADRAVHAGVVSAVGFLSAPIAYELVRSQHVRLDSLDVQCFSDLLDESPRSPRAFVEPGRRRRAGAVAARGPSCGMSGQATRLRQFRTAAERQPYIAGRRKLSRNTIRPCSNVLIPGAAIEVLRLVGLCHHDPARLPRFAEE